MLAKFILWIVVFVGVFFRKNWVVPLTVAALVWTAIILRLHMTDPIPLSF